MADAAARFRNLLRDIKERNHVSERDMGAKVGCSGSAINQVLKGRILPGQDFVSGFWKGYSNDLAERGYSLASLQILRVMANEPELERELGAQTVPEGEKWRAIVRAKDARPFMLADQRIIEHPAIVRSRPVSRAFTKDGKAFYVIATEAMAGGGLHEGDEVLVEASEEPQSGDVAFVIAPGEEPRIGKWAGTADHVQVLPLKGSTERKLIRLAQEWAESGAAARRVAGWFTFTRAEK